MSGPARGGAERLIGGLALRVVTFLSLALLPVGLAAIVQTRGYQMETQRRQELALLALVERSVAQEADVIERALGAASALGAVIDPLAADPGVCSEAMREVVSAEGRFVFAGFVPASGIMTCSTAGRPVDFRGKAGFEAYRRDPRRAVTARETGLVSGGPVIVVAEPIFREGGYVGAVTISIPHELLRLPDGETGLLAQEGRSLQLIAFNVRGEVLSAQDPDGAFTEGDLPRRPLPALTEGGAETFVEKSRDGKEHFWAVTPVVPGTVYALGSWDRPPRAFDLLSPDAAAVAFPLLMWAISLIVAAYSIHRLVLVHVEELRRKMRAFGRSRLMIETPTRRSTPAEFREIDAEFMAMAESILRDEAQQENAVREKNVLLKEVHHRVKNNLQLISSIMSMKRRKATSPEAVDLLMRLQDRILSLAAIHRHLYQSQDMSAVDAGRIIREIADQHGFGPRTNRGRFDLEHVTLVPAQAAPLALLVAEVLSSCRRHSEEVGPFTVSISLRALREHEAELRITVPTEVRDGAHEWDDLSRPLVAAFADQMDGRLTDEERDGLNHMTLRFTVLAAVPEAVDY